jgi:hypothetical protein
MEENDTIDILRRQKWFKAKKVIIMLRMVLVLKWIFAMCFMLVYYASPFASLGVSVWRLAQRDYGDAGRDTANSAKLAAALDIFYALILLQSLFALYHVVIDLGRHRMIPLTIKHSGLFEELGSKVLHMYYSETKRKFKKDGNLPSNWNLVTYAVGLLQSASEDDYLLGARVLDKLFDKDASVRQQLLSSMISIRNLIGMINRRGTSADSRNCAARILAHLASDLHVSHLPGILPCICSLLESCKKFYETQFTCLSENPQQRLQETYQHRPRQILVIPEVFIQTPNPPPDKLSIDLANYEYIAKELIHQVLHILERLTQDEENCTEIRKHQRLLSKITSPLRSRVFLHNEQDREKIGIKSRSLTVISRLLTSPRDGATTLRQELVCSTEAVSNLMAILEQYRNKGARKLRQRALEILTELATDDSFKKQDFNKLCKALLCIFLEDAPSNNTVDEMEQADRENATTLIRGKAGEALARLLPLSTARDANVSGILSKQEVVNLLAKVIRYLCQCLFRTIFFYITPFF